MRHFLRLFFFYYCTAVDVTFPESFIFFWTCLDSATASFYCVSCGSPDLLDLIAETPVKKTNIYADVQRERDRDKHFLNLEGYLSGALEDNGRHAIKFENEK